MIQIGEETLVHVHLILAARHQVDHAHDDQQPGRNNRADHTAPFRDLADPRKTLQGDQRGDPIDGQYDHDREEFVGGQRHVVLLVHADKGDRNSTEGEYGGVPDGRLDPLQENRQKTGSGPEGFAHPTKYAALLIREHGRQFGCDHGRRNQKDDGGKQIIEGRRKSIFGLGRQSSQTDHRRDIHDGEGHYAQFEPL